MPIDFFQEEIEFQLKAKQSTINWIEEVVRREGRQIDEINYIFCSDEYLYKINVDYLNHNTYTDIVTFDHSDGPKLAADIFISIDRVRENSISHDTTFNDELHRVIIHGILHLCGHKDKTNDQKAQMRKREDSYLSLRDL